MEDDKERKKNNEGTTYPSKMTLKETIVIGHENKRFNRHLRNIKNQRKGMKISDDHKKEIFTVPTEQADNVGTEHRIKPNQEIKIDSKNQIQSNDPAEIIYKPVRKHSIKNKKNTNKNRFCCLKILIIISIAAILIGLGVGLYFLLKKKTPESTELTPPEKLVSGLTYQVNQILKFQNIKKTKINYEFDDKDNPNDTRTLIEYFDYIIGITSEDKLVEDNKEKEVYAGFIFLENYMIDNETEKMLMQNSSIFEEIEEINSLRYLSDWKRRNLEEKKYFNFSLNEIKVYCCIDNGTLPIMKFDFYRNGKIRKIYKPRDLMTLFYDNFIEILEKVIPRISEEDFNYAYNNISEALEKEFEKIKNNSIEEITDDGEEYKDEFEDEEDDEYYEYEEEKEDEENEEGINNRRFLRNKKIKKNSKKAKVLKFKKQHRILDQDDQTDIFENNDIDREEINQILEQEYDTESDINLYIFDKDNNTESNKINNTNLNYYSHSPVRNEFAEFKGSQQNTSIISKIDENTKALKEVHYITKGKLINDSNFGEELEKDREKSCSNDNLLNCQDLSDDTFENVVDSKFKSIDYEIIEDIISTGNYIDNKKSAINKINEIFKEYDNNIEIDVNNERANSSQRFLRAMTDYILANRFDYSDVVIQIGRKNNRNLNEDESSVYYGMKNIEYSKNIFSLNIIGLKMKLEVTNTMKVKEGKSVVKIKLQFAFINISITLKTLKTNIHLIIRNYNEMGFTEIYLMNESKNKLEKRNEKYADIIINLEKEFSNLISDKYDFSNIFKDSFSEMHEQIKNFTTEIFTEFINIIRNAYGNYTEILDDIIDNKHEVFNEIRIITKNEYINFINKSLLLVEVFNNKTYDFLLEVKEEVGRIDNFQLDLLYDLIDIIYETKKIFKDFNKNLFLAIEKGIKKFRYNLNDFVYEMMGDLLYLVDFLSVNLNKNDILKNGMDSETREEITIKLINMRNIINFITETLLNNIDNDYKQEMNEDNINSIKVVSEEKLKKYLYELEVNSMNIIEDIKNKIAFINLYELYAGNLDKIESTTNELNDIFFSDLYGKTLEKIQKLQPEYLNNNSLLIKEKEKLFENINLIDKNIKEDINDINDYINIFTKNYKIKKQYYIYYNLYNFRKSFINKSMEQLRQKFIKLINDTILISIKDAMTNNYNLGIQWLQEIVNELIPLHKRDECLQAEFYTKYGKFIKVFESFLPNAYSDTSIEVYRKYFNQIKNNILNTVKSKMRKLNYYYLNSPIYDDNFYFVYQINNEIAYLIDNLNNYYSDDYFDSEIVLYITKFTPELLESINENLRSKFESLKKTCERHTDCVRGRNWGDYCWNNKRIFHNWHYYSVPHTNNYKKLDKTFKKIENFIKKETNIVIQEFINNFSPYLNTYIKEIQTLFDNLYNYIEIKLKSNEDLNELINQYSKILDKMLEITENKIELKGIDVEFLMEKVKNKTISIDSDFFENYYLNNFTSYLEYPDEVLYKLSNLENELSSNSEIIKHHINYIINKKMWRIKEDNYYYIVETNNFFNELIKYRLNDVHIFEYYKEYRLTNNFGKILRKYNYTNYNTKEFLTENIFDNNINKMIKDYRIIINKIEQRINNDWILKNCTEINISSNNNYSSYSIENIDNNNITNLICYEYKNKSSLNYSEYNYNVVKIRTGIYYIKYLYEKLEYLFNQFNINDVLNLSKIIQKDEIINNKNIINLNKKSKEKLNVINKDTEDILKEYFEYYKEDINETIKNELDFTLNFDKFKKILNYTEENFIQEVQRKSDNITFILFELLKEYNETLMKQIKSAKQYEKYNFNKTIFNNITHSLLEKIEQSFDNVINNTKNIMDDYIFKNTLKIKLETLNNEKAKYFRNFVDDLNNNYEIKPFNLTYDVGQKTENFILNVLNNIMFSHIYEYVELYEKNNNIYIKSLLNILNLKKEKIIKAFKEITNNFYNDLNEKKTEYINKEYLKMYENNYTLCLNYSNDKINETIKKDEENYNKYIIYINRREMCEKFNKKQLYIDNIDIIKLNIIESDISK